MTGHAAAVVRRTTRVALTAGAAIGVLSVLGVVLGSLLGLRPMVVTSGSMSPAIPAGSLVVAEETPAADVVIGDVVAVEVADGRVMHRVVAAHRSGADTVLTLRGDANGAPDEDPYVVRQVDLVRFDVPLLGHPVSWLSTPWGLLFLGAGACGLLVFAFRPAPAQPGRRRRVSALVAAPLAGVVVTAAAAPSSAWFDDHGTVTLGTVSTYAVPVPTLSCGGVGLLSVSFSWTAVPGATSYTLHHGIGGGVTTTVNSTSHTVVAAVAGGTAWVTANRNFGSTTWVSGQSNHRSYTVAVVSVCS